MTSREPGPATARQPHALREYALLADGERGILVGPEGDFAFMCFPRWHDPALFASLIGGRGTYAITPEDRFTWGGYYERGSLIWHSRWIAGHTVVECREALALPTRPGRAVVLRRLETQRGAARMKVLLDLRSDFGRRAPRSLHQEEDGRWSIDLGHRVHATWTGGERARLVSNGDGGHFLGFELTVEAGKPHDFVLTLTQGGAEEPLPDPSVLWSGTESRWREVVPDLRTTVGRRDAEQAYAVLTGLTSLGGGMVASATTSLPERAEQGRNYDYRYVWIRDQCYAGQAAALAGPCDLLTDAVRFVQERLLEDGPDLKPAYTIDGERVPDETTLRLPGYPGGTDIVGNWVNQQFQLDALGECLLLFTAADRLELLDADGWRAVEAAVSAIEKRWQGKDAGIWELQPRRWTHSRLSCVAGLRAIGERERAGQLGARWAALADQLLADAGLRGVHSSGRWQRADDDERVDASLLMAQIRGAVPADDPRSVRTLQAVLDDLCEEGYCYRYRPDERPLGEAEGAFLLCGFMVSLAHWQRGERTQGARWFERTRAACGPPGLFSEEYDVSQRQLRGNLPQAFVHALLLETALRQGQEELPAEEKFRAT